MSVLKLERHKKIIKENATLDDHFILTNEEDNRNKKRNNVHQIESYDNHHLSTLYKSTRVNDDFSVG